MADFHGPTIIMMREPSKVQLPSYKCKWVEPWMWIGGIEIWQKFEWPSKLSPAVVIGLSEAVDAEIGSPPKTTYRRCKLMVANAAAHTFLLSLCTRRLAEVNLRFVTLTTEKPNNASIGDVRNNFPHEHLHGPKHSDAFAFSERHTTSKWSEPSWIWRINSVHACNLLTVSYVRYEDGETSHTITAYWSHDYFSLRLPFCERFVHSRCFQAVARLSFNNNNVFSSPSFYQSSQFPAAN